MNGSTPLPRVFFHVDLDAFFASVEQLDTPGYRGRPVIVGGLPGDRRAVVSTASYEARRYGVHSAMPLAQAVQLCPHAVFLRGRHQRYQQKSQEVMALFGAYSPTVIQISVDEAFIDMTGTERLFGPPADVARRLKAEVLQKTGLTVSVGVASTMYIAKIASGLRKPDGLTVVEPGQEEAFMLSLPLEKLWGAGGKTLARLRGAGFRTTADIRSRPLGLLTGIFGKGTGTFLYNAVRGNEGMTFGTEPKNHSISSEATFDFDLADRYTIDTALMELAENVLYRMHRENVRSRTVALKIRYDDFTTVSAQSTSDTPVASAEDMFGRCTALFSKKYEAGRGVRLLGVACENVESREEPVQGDLFSPGADAKRARVEQAVYAMKDKGIRLRKARLMTGTPAARHGGR